MKTSVILLILFVCLISSANELKTSETRISIKWEDIKPYINSEVTEEDFKSKVLVIDFWATWCEPCRRSFPQYEKLYKNYKSKIIWIALSVDENKNNFIQFKSKNTSNFIVINEAEGKLAKLFKIKAIPTLLLFNKEKELIYFHRGFYDDTINSVEKDLSNLVK